MRCSAQQAVAEFAGIQTRDSERRLAEFWRIPLGKSDSTNAPRGFTMNVLAVDIGGTHVKILATGQDEPRKFLSGPTLTAERMVAEVKQIAADWKYDAVAMGYPGPVLHGRPLA